MPAPMRYENLFSHRLPAPPDFPRALARHTKYDFSTTYTDPDTLPTEAFWQALRTALRREGRDLALYPPPQGHPGLRNLIAQRLKAYRGMDAAVDNIFLSSGALGAIGAILDVFLDPGDIVLLESYSYMGTLRMMLNRRAQVVHIPTDDQGMQTDALESTVKTLVAQGKQPKLIFTISVYQNPLGMTLSLERRKQMLEVSHRYGIPILEDEVYADLRYEGDLPPPLYEMDEAGTVLFVSSFSKLVGCGVRLGYGVVPPAVKEKVALMRYGGAPSHLAAMMAHEYLREHLDEHVVQINASLKVKRDTLLAALGEHFPPSCAWSRPQGGMHVWVRLPEGADTLAALPKAMEADVRYTPGSLFHGNGEGKHYLRLCFSYNTPAEIREGVAILARVLAREGLFQG